MRINIKALAIVFSLGLLLACSYNDEASEYMADMGWEGAPKKCYDIAERSIARIKGYAASKAGSGAGFAAQEGMERPYRIAQCICEEAPDSEMCKDAKTKYLEAKK